MSATAIPAQAPTRTRIASAAGGMLIVIVIAVGSSLILADPGRRAAVEALVGSPIGLITLFVFSALSSATLVLPVPGMALTVMAAAVADPLLVGIFAGAGQAVGELTGYAAGTSGAALAGERLSRSRMADWMRRYGVATIFLLAIVPNPVFDIAGVLAGALRMPLVRYLAAAASGKILRNTLLAFATVHGGLLLAGLPS
ncbi:MAG: VTT domain-containing protein [Chloroflexi bacterium]|nr:VTT domain-containing protein [Chloroflexota bacterium]